MDWIESLITAWNGLNANKMRSGLTMLGVIIGVAAVIALLSIGQGVQESIAVRSRVLDRTCSLSRLVRFKWAEYKLPAEVLPALRTQTRKPSQIRATYRTQISLRRSLQAIHK